MYNMDYFSILGLSNTEKYKVITPQMVEEKYNEAIKRLTEQYRRIENDDSKDYQEKMNVQTELNEYYRMIKKAYDYCIKDWALVLRNKILEINSNTDSKTLSNITEKTLNDGNEAIGIKIKPEENLKKVDQDIKLIARLYGIEYINKIPSNMNTNERYDGDGFIDKTLSNYEMILSGNNESEGYSYNFYAGGIDLEKLRRDPNYRKILLQALEKEYMSSDTVKYIGYIAKESDGKYTILKDSAQKKAARKAHNEIMRQKEEEKYL